MLSAPTIPPIDHLRKRAFLLKNIRAYFETKNILEVETPILSQSTVTSPFITSIQAQVEHQQEQTYYLQTSPEFAMKRLLAAGIGDIFQITKAFRNKEYGSRHNIEFTMLEWYRVGFNHTELMKEVDDFLQSIAQTLPARFICYRDLFWQYLQIDPWYISLLELQQLCTHYSWCFQGIFELTQDTLLDLLLTHEIEPYLGKNQTPDFIYDFPPSQAALAKIRDDSRIPPIIENSILKEHAFKKDTILNNFILPTENGLIKNNVSEQKEVTGKFRVAERFEVYLGGMELANGFHELTDAQEQRHRFLAENNMRKELKLPQIPLDENFLAALKKGLPQCAGVALGVDRLLMTLLNVMNIEEVIAFPINKA